MLQDVVSAQKYMFQDYDPTFAMSTSRPRSVHRLYKLAGSVKVTRSTAAICADSIPKGCPSKFQFKEHLGRRRYSLDILNGTDDPECTLAPRNAQPTVLVPFAGRTFGETFRSVFLGAFGSASIVSELTGVPFEDIQLLLVDTELPDQQVSCDVLEGDGRFAAPQRLCSTPRMRLRSADGNSTQAMAKKYTFTIGGSKFDLDIQAEGTNCNAHDKQISWYLQILNVTREHMRAWGLKHIFTPEDVPVPRTVFINAYYSSTSEYGYKWFDKDVGLSRFARDMAERVRASLAPEDGRRNKIWIMPRNCAYNPRCECCTCKRLWVNSSQIAQQLVKRYPNHEIINTDLNGLDLNSVVQLMSKTQVAVSVHSSGLWNTLFLRPGSVVVEIWPSEYYQADYEQFTRQGGSHYIKGSAVEGHFFGHHAWVITPLEQVVNYIDQALGIISGENPP